MDNSRQNEEEMKSCIEVLNDAKKELPNIVIPSMGVVDDDKKIDIDVQDYFINDNENQ